MRLIARRPYSLLLLLAGILVPALVVLSPFLQVWMRSADMTFLTPGLLEFPHTIIFAAVLAGVFAVIGYRRLRRMKHRDPQRVFFVFLMVGFFFSILPGPYVGTLLVCFYAGVTLAVLAGHDYRLRFSAIHYWMLIYLIVCAASLHTYTRGGSTFQIQQAIQPFSRFLTVLFIVNFLREWDDFVFTTKVFVAITCVVALIAIYQVLAFSVAGKITSLLPPEEKGRRFFTMGGFTFLRATALFRSPVSLGQACGFGALMLMVPLSNPDISRKSALRILAVFALMMVGLFCSFSRASWMAFIIVAFLAPPLLRPKWAVRYILVLSVLGGVFVISGGLAAVVDYMTLAKTTSIDYRVEIIRIGLQALERHPTLGAGLEIFRGYPGNLEKLHVHNTFIMAFSELGIVGGLTIIGLYIHSTSRAIRNLHLAVDPMDRNLAIVLFLALILVLIMQQFEQALHFHLNYFLLGSIEAMTIYLRKKAGGDPAAHLRREELLRNLPRSQATFLAQPDLPPQE